MPQVFEHRGDGELWCTMHRSDAEAIALVSDQLRELIEGETREADPIVERLFPRAYLDPTEEQAERDWDAFVRPDLASGKVAALAALADALRRAASSSTADEAGNIVESGVGNLVQTRLGEQDAELWLSALHDLRLALGTRLGVGEEGVPEENDAEDLEAAWWSVYDYLTWFQGMLVEELLVADRPGRPSDPRDDG